MTYDIKPTSQFKKDVKRMLKQGKELQDMLDIVEMLQNDIPLPEKCHDHSLSGNWKGKRACHIDPDWLLIYEKCETLLLLILVRTGSHSQTLKI